MKEFIIDFLELLANCVMVICLAFSSFLLLSNFYHYKEITHQTFLNLDSYAEYKEYKDTMALVDKKMKSVNLNKSGYGTSAKPIYEYYDACIKSLNSGTFAKLESKTSITAKDVYDMNNEILKDYNNKCIFYIPYNITVINKNYHNSVPFSNVYKTTEEKRSYVVANADYLTKAQLGNSSYGFVTDTTRGGIFDKTYIEFRLTINNYKLMSSILNDVADWYVAEFGGNE